MTTKTLTIMEDAYKMLLQNKQKDESFSDEIRRILSRKKSKDLSHFFGILSEKKGKGMVDDLEKARSMNIKLLKQRIKR